jgi:CubicO group peptidase (beta-lactamase class C family)
MTSGLTDDLSFEAEPGTLWRYNTNAFQMLHSVIGHAANTTMEDWTASKLGQQIGWQDASWRDRAKLKLPDGTPQRGLQLSARDAARFGLLTLRSGKWDDKQVVSTNYVGEALTASTTLNPAYGLLWWLNGKQSYMVPGSSKSRPGPLIPPAPTDLVAAMGALDQRIYVVPSRQWVIVRQGRQANAGEAGAEALSGFDTDFFTRLMAAAPK